MSTDRHLQKAVIAELGWDVRVNAADIGVVAHDGIVTLTGHVETGAEKQNAEATTGRVQGCKGVADELTVRLSPGAVRQDEEIASAIVQRLEWNAAIPKGAILPAVEKGWVTLTGEVKWHFQKEDVEHDVRRLIGVAGVTNRITIKPQVDVVGVADDIRAALNRSWFFDKDTIGVSADGGKVTLTGTVPSLHGRHAAERAAWGAAGTVDVANFITVV
ncbi:BON domain-containing protein [Sphingomonas sp. 10B4]|uniref:BON domain-containing protein n=1 Tax=Sphingomonas sp. 10B4 TaxID=3048575 RepID=UPI002AB577AB|nr:BON domain-containing protein [Sphingomonas sp. 10B4]MDY7523696.1 BON domain-containing protein [Sphingomonas sp. 10B4]MEB0284547.1 BON domain-containing protein [Sphingomonas sp. 10B4]